MEDGEPDSINSFVELPPLPDGLSVIHHITYAELPSLPVGLSPMNYGGDHTTDSTVASGGKEELPTYRN